MPSTDIQNLLQGTGISFDYKLILIGIVSGVVGWSAWRYGRKKQSGRHMILGVGLMVYPYFILHLWWSLAVGSLLTALLFWP